MRTTGTRSLVLHILGLAFLAGLAVFLYGLFFNGDKWAVQKYNKYLSAGGQLSNAGEILDRNNVVLAKSENGKRVYPPDEKTRRAVLHAVGDTDGFISTGVQYNYQQKLSGYNPITGLISPTGKAIGNDIYLTIDSNLNRVALEKLGTKKGAAILYNYKTGEILCMVSSPNYDPMNIPKDLNTNKKYEGAFLNHVLSSSYAPGSIFKIVTTACALENIPDIANRKFTCKGSTVINGNKITCMAKHGTIGLQKGLAKSCNIVFAELALQLGKEKMTATANSMGFNTSFNMDGIPTSKSVYEGKDAQDNELAWSGIGQYKDLTNPYHMVLLMGAIANEGTPVQPYMIQNIKTKFNLSVQAGHTENGQMLLKKETANELKNLMRNNVQSEYGDSMFPGMAVCAKTGTAEVGGGKHPNGWMVGFSSESKTPLAFAVVVEEGDYGRISAGTVASAIMKEAAKNIK